MRLSRKECLGFFMRYNTLWPGSEEMRNTSPSDENARNLVLYVGACVWRDSKTRLATASDLF